MLIKTIWLNVKATSAAALVRNAAADKGGQIRLSSSCPSPFISVLIQLSVCVCVCVRARSK